MKLQFLEAGEIVSTHGVRGEMKVLPWADGPDFLCDFHRVRIGGVEYKVDNCRVQKSCNLLKIQGIDTMEAAQAMRGKVVEVFRCDAPEDLIFAAELIGVRVFDGDTEIGELVDVLDYPGNKVYVVKRQRAGVKAARLEFSRLAGGDTSLVRIRLHTGRSHQIRVQFASRGYPLVGDHKYGARDDVSAPMLYSCCITFPHKGEQKVFSHMPLWAKTV